MRGARPDRRAPHAKRPQAIRGRSTFGAVFGRGELGVALATGSASSVATSSSGAAFHGALALGVRAGSSIGTGRLDLALDLGVASTATAQLDHHDELSLGTWVITATAGMVFP